MTTIARNYITIANIKDGKQGKQGKQGEGGLSVMAIPSHLTFDTDQNGTILLTNNNANKARIVVFEGLKSVSAESITLKPYNCQASHNGDTITINSIDQGQANGRVEVAVTYKGNTYTTSLTFYVSKQRWNESEFANTIERLNSVKREIQTDYQGRIKDVQSQIEQTANNINLSITSLPFNSRNLLKGASMRFPQIFNLTGNPEWFTFKEKGGYLDLPTLTLRRTNATHDEWNNLRTPVIKLTPTQTYTFSTHAQGEGNVFYELRAAATPDMANSTTLISGTLQGQWTTITRNFTPPTNQPYIQLVFGIQRNGYYTLSGLQIEKGNKATPWVDPDYEERFRRAGIDINLQRIIATTDNFYIKNSEGQVTAAIDKDGNLIAGTLRTKDNGEGYIYLHDNMQEYYKHGANHPSRRIGYIGNDWVDQRLSDDGNVIWEMNERGIVHYQTPERWVRVSDAYITTIESIKKFFLINQGRTLYLIFNSSNHKSATLKEYVAARDVNGNIISSAMVTVEEGQANDGKLFYTSQDNEGLSLGDRFELDNNKFSSPFTGLILASKPIHYYPFNNQSDQTAIPPEYTKFRQLYGVEDYYNVNFNYPAEWAYINIYHLGRRIGSHRMFRNK